MFFDHPLTKYLHTPKGPSPSLTSPLKGIHPSPLPKSGKKEGRIGGNGVVIRYTSGNKWKIVGKKEDARREVKIGKRKKGGKK